MPQPKRATIKDVAKTAGISIQTVSRVINNHPDVAPETRKRILQIIDDLDYRPSALARGLIHQRTHALGVVTAGLKYIGPSFTLNGILEMAGEKGFTVTLEELPGFHIDQVNRLLNSLLEKHVDGIIWAVPEIGDNRKWVEENLVNLPVPIVFLTMQIRPGINSVSYDNVQGAFLATSHLLQSGYHHIGHISGPLDWWEAKQRKMGWEKALSEAGLTPENRQVSSGNWSSASGIPAFLHLLDHFPELDAVFVANDQMAFSVLQTAARMGMKIPTRLGVVGFDGLAESAYLWPPLTTVFQNLNFLGRTAVEQVVHLIDCQLTEKPELEPETIVLMPELILRESSLSSLVPTPVASSSIEEKC